MSTAKRSRRWPWVVGIIAVVAGSAAVFGSRHGGPKELDSSLIVAAKRGDLPIDVVEVGKISPREKVEVKSKVAGQVSEVLVDEGMTVKKGQLLLRIDATDFRRDVAQREADVMQREADIEQSKNMLEFAQLTLQRREKGLDARGVAQIDVDTAKNELKSKQVAVHTAEVILTGAKVQLGADEDRLHYTSISAPMDGTVIQRGIQPGEVVTPGVQATFEGKALLTVADLSTLIAKVDLNQIDVAKVILGQKVDLTLDALPGKTYAATITKVAPASNTPKDKQVDVFPVEATLAVADKAIKPGMTADVRIHIETKNNVLSLPIEAVVKENGKSYVNHVITDAKGKQTTEKVEVTVGVRNDRDVVVETGLKEGDKVLIKPASASENEMK